jgi:hypothetical protein
MVNRSVVCGRALHEKFRRFVARPTPVLEGAGVGIASVRCDRVERAGQGHGVHRETVERCEQPPKA